MKWRTEATEGRIQEVLGEIDGGYHPETMGALERLLGMVQRNMAT
jgi:hypothetical protein